MEDKNTIIIKFIKKEYTSKGKHYETLFFYSHPPVVEGEGKHEPPGVIIPLEIDVDTFEFINLSSDFNSFNIDSLLKAIQKGLKKNKGGSNDIALNKFLKFENSKEEKYESSKKYKFNSLIKSVDSFDEKYKNLIKEKGLKNLNKTQEIISLQKEANSFQEELNSIYDGIDLSLKKEELKSGFFAKKTNYNDQLLDFLNSLFANLFMEPTIVKIFFSNQLEIATDKDSFSNQKMIKGEDITLKQERLETIILKNVAKVNAIVNGDPEDIAKRTEGVFAYYNKEDSLIDLTTSESLVLGWVPYIKHNEVIHCLSSRNVQFEYKFLDRLNNPFDEEGWIHPDAMNETIESNNESRKLLDNPLLFQYIGESLGYESIISQVEKKESSSETLVENFIKEFIYTKTVKPAKESKQIPLLDKEKYSFALLPMDLYGNIKEVTKNNGLINIDNSFFTEEPFIFRVLEPVSPPELIPCPKSVEDLKENSTIVLKHYWNGKRNNNLEEEFAFLPPKVEFNIAKYVKTFSLNNKTSFEDIYPWLVKLENEVPTVWKGNSNTKMKYTFDKRVLNNELILELFEIIYNEEKEFFDKLLSRISIKNNWKKMDEARSLKLIIRTVPSYYKKLTKPFLESKNKVLIINIPEGKQFRIKYKYSDGNNNPSGETTIINAVSKLLSNDGENEIAFENETGVQIVRDMSYIRLNFKVKNVNFNIVDYYYLLKRYRKIHPSEWSELPDLKYILKNRDKHELIDERLIDLETDVTVNQYTKSANENETFDPFSYVDDSLDINLISDYSILKNKDVIFNVCNVFELEELFSEIKVDFLKPMNWQEASSTIDNKIGFGRINGIGDYSTKNLYYENEDKRAKQIDYINFKIYSKHLNHFKEHLEDNTLKKLDYNLSKVFNNRNTNDKSFIYDNYDCKQNCEIIYEISAPKFDLDLLFFDDIDEENNSKNKTRKSMLLITFDKNELNRLSDNDYFGIDLSKEEVKVGATVIETRKTDLGVDFTLDNFEANNLKPDWFKVPIDLIKDANKKQKLVFNSEGIREVKEYVNGDNEFVFIKPLYLYNENKGFILLDVSKMINNNENSLDPFLKISLCQGYSTSYSYEDGRIIWRRTKSSEPKYIQLSSKRSVQIKRGDNYFIININSQIKSNHRTSHFIAFYPKGKQDFKEAISLTMDKSNDSQSYFLLNNDFLKSNFENIIRMENDSFIISNNSNQIKVKTNHNSINFNINDYDLKLFEFNYYNNVDEEKLSLRISRKDFNPFNDSYFKLIFSA
jgi:hypothetical protein